MKQKDITLIAVVVFISAISSFLLSKSLISSPKSRHQKVEVVQVITSDFLPPDARYFNSNSIDPTQVITIGQNNNSNPFSSISR